MCVRVPNYEKITAKIISFILLNLRPHCTDLKLKRKNKRDKVLYRLC